MEIDVVFDMKDQIIPVDFQDDTQLLNPDFGSVQVVRVGEFDHARLINRDAADQHPIESITGLREALDNTTGFTTDNTLYLENGVLGVNTAKSVDAEDGTLPVTAAAVNATVGNIEILLQTI